MLTIRMQRTGRKGHAMFRVVVQDSRRTPSSGKVVALIGNYDPHTKAASLTKDKAKFYLEHGAQPSARVARLLKSEGVSLPKWVKVETKGTRSIRNLEKLRKNRPAGAPAPESEAPDLVPETESKTDAVEPAPEVETPVEDKPEDSLPVADESADKPVEPAK